jgi:tetratricopeptide (TPR) repeat protein
MIATGPILGLKRQAQSPTPDPGKGETKTGAATVTQPVDDHWSANVAAAIKAGDLNKAVSILRDAIDIAPMDVARRVLFVKTLMRMGQPEVAAREARRAAELMPDHLEFRSLAARAWIAAGNGDEAQADLNEAVTRAPDSADTRMLLAEVAIDKGDSAIAIGHLDKAILVGPTGDAYYLRALAHAMAGDTGLAMADIKKAVDSGLSQDPQEAEARYGLVAAVFDDGITSIGNEIRSLQARALVSRTDKNVKSAYADLVKRVSGRAKFISELPAPQVHETSHNRRVLAYKLLSQCLTDLDSFLKNGDEDVLTDSRINLGESLKQGASARQRFKDEQQGVKTSNGKPG